MIKEKVRYYQSFSDDFEQSRDQNFTLNDDYKWVRNDFISKILSSVIYFLAIVFSTIYCRLFLHLKVKGKENLKGVKGGFFIYGNHTQPIGDVFTPALCVLPRRIYTVVSMANYGIPFIGKILPYLGALPIVNTLHGMKELQKAIKYRLEHNHPIVIYPEAHVWEYYTEIRPFNQTAFKFPVKFQKPSFAMTVTYKKSKIFKRPVMEVFLDGPFYPKGDTQKQMAENLHNEIFEIMTQRSKNSNYNYIKYQKEDKKECLTEV